MQMEGWGEGFSAEMKERQNIRTELFLDTVHLNRSVAAAISRSGIKPQLVASAKVNAKLVKQAKNRRADSIPHRAESEARAALSKFKNEEEIVAAAGKAIPALVKCYERNHELCVKHSLVCNGKTTQHEYKPKFAQGSFKFCAEDVGTLSKILKKRMGERHFSRHVTTSQHRTPSPPTMPFQSPTLSTCCTQEMVKIGITVLYI